MSIPGDYTCRGNEMNENSISSLTMEENLREHSLTICHSEWNTGYCEKIIFFLGKTCGIWKERIQLTDYSSYFVKMNMISSTRRFPLEKTSLAVLL